MKNTFSFRHDYGARNDPKIRKMIARLGPSAGWAWWVIVEELFEQGGRMPLESICEISYDAHVPEEMVRSIIFDFELFRVTRKEFYSERIIFELTDKENRSSAAQKNANARWDKYKRDKELKQVSDAMPNATASENDAIAYATASKNDAKGKGKEKVNEEIDANASSPQVEQSELQSEVEKKKITKTNQVMDLWNKMIAETGAQLPPLAKFTEKRRKKVQIRWREFADIGDPSEVVMKVFQNACSSKFFQGDNPRGWSGTFDWIFENEKNWVKVYEGNYDDKQRAEASGYNRLRVEVKGPEDYEGDF